MLRRIDSLLVAVAALTTFGLLTSCSDDGSDSTGDGGAAGSHTMGGAAGSGHGGAAATGGASGSSGADGGGMGGAAGTAGSGQGGSAGMPGSTDAPTILAVIQMAGALHISWSLPAAGCDSIELSRNHDGGAFAKAYTLTGKAADIHDMQAVPPGSYCYRARCVLGGQPSSDSNEKCGTP